MSANCRKDGEFQRYRRPPRPVREVVDSAWVEMTGQGVVVYDDSLLEDGS